MDVNQPTDAPPYRRLTVLDMMGLVLASGFGIWTAHQLRLRGVGMMGWASKPWPTDWESWAMLGSHLMTALACLLSVSSCRLERRQRLTPGFFTAYIVIVAVGFKFLGWFERGLRSNFPDDFNPLRHEHELFWTLILDNILCAQHPGFHACLGVIVGWMILFLQGSWSRPTGTLDLLGRVIGLWFIGQNLADYALFLLEIIKRVGFRELIFG